MICNLNIIDRIESEQILDLPPEGQHLSSVTAVSFNKKSKLLITGSKDKTVQIWNYEINEEVCLLHFFDSEILSVGYGSGDKIIYATTIAGTIYLFKNNESFTSISVIRNVVDRY